MVIKRSKKVLEMRIAMMKTFSNNKVNHLLWLAQESQTGIQIQENAIPASIKAGRIKQNNL